MLSVKYWGRMRPGRDIVEFRTVAQDAPDLSLFTKGDLSFLDTSISHYWKLPERGKQRRIARCGVEDAIKWRPYAI